MKKLLCVLFLCLSVATYAQKELVKVGDTMPPFTIVSDNGSKIESSSFKGQVILINLFATWCPPCQKELEDVRTKVWPTYKNNSSFRLLVIGREHSDADLKTYNEKKGFTFPLYPDKNRKIYSAFAENTIPRSYLIGKDGKVIYAGTGYTEEEFAVLLTKIEQALKAK